MHTMWLCMWRLENLWPVQWGVACWHWDKAGELPSSQVIESKQANRSQHYDLHQLCSRPVIWPEERETVRLQRCYTHSVCVRVVYGNKKSLRFNSIFLIIIFIKQSIFLMNSAAWTDVLPVRHKLSVYVRNIGWTIAYNVKAGGGLTFSNAGIYIFGGLFFTLILQWSTT